MSPAIAPAILATRPAVDLDVRFVCERAQDGPAVDALVDAAFGPGRFAKTAERLREGNRLRRDLSFCAWIDGEMSGEALVGAVRQWPIRIGETPALFLGPIATSSERRGQGYGRALVAHCREEAALAGETLILLVGERAYFEPLGFEPVPAGDVILPGPVDARRLLWATLTPQAAHGVSGLVKISP